MTSINSRFRYYIVNKPYGVISQFSPEGNHQTLADLTTDLPKDVYPVGRLDTDSEGLLLLTNDNRFKTKLLNPQSEKEKTYWVQVEGDITDEAIEALENGVEISVNGKTYRTKPARVSIMPEPLVWERDPPIRVRQHIPTSWIALSITEGKNRQVRKMTAKVGFPTLRLIRFAVGKLTIKQVALGEVKEISAAEAQLAMK